MSEPLIICCAITGAEVTKEQQPNLPVTPKEQAKAAKKAVDAGASIIHLHVRDDQGNPTQSIDRFEESITEIRILSPEVIIQISTGGAVGESIDNRMAPLTLKPEMASLNMGSMNFGDELFLNSAPDIKSMAEYIYKNDVMPELEIYDVAMLEYAAQCYKKGIIKDPLHFQFVLGVPGGLSGEERNLEFLLKVKDEIFSSNVSWSVAGIGRYQLPVARLAIEKGGHVRVGFEDNIYIEKGKLADSNAQMVQMAVAEAQKIGRPVASCNEARSLMGL